MSASLSNTQRTGHDAELTLVRAELAVLESELAELTKQRDDRVATCERLVRAHTALAALASPVFQQEQRCAAQQRTALSVAALAAVAVGCAQMLPDTWPALVGGGGVLILVASLIVCRHARLENANLRPRAERFQDSLENLEREHAQQRDVAYRLDSDVTRLRQALIPVKGREKILAMARHISFDLHPDDIRRTPEPPFQVTEMRPLKRPVNAPEKADRGKSAP